MKKLFSIAIVALLTVSTYAQEQQRKPRHPDLTPNHAEIQTKKMTLKLELSEKQYQQILEINKRNAIERKRNMEEKKALREKGQNPSNDFANRMNVRLDKQIAHQKEMTKILSEKQFETWKNSKKQRTHKKKKRMSNQKMQHRSKMPRKG